MREIEKEVKGKMEGLTEGRMEGGRSTSLNDWHALSLMIDLHKGTGPTG